MAKSYQQMWEEQKRKGAYQTRDGGYVYKNPVQSQTQKAVEAAQKQQDSGIYVTRDNGTVKSPGKSYGSGYKASKKAPKISIPEVVTPKGYKAPKVTPKNVRAAISAVDGSALAAKAYQDRLNAAAQDDEEEETVKDMEKRMADERYAWEIKTRGELAEGAPVPYYTRDNAVVYKQETTDNPNTGADSNLRAGMLDTIHNPTAATWQQDPGIVNALNKHFGGVQQLYYTDANGNRAAMPMQNLNVGGGNYVDSLLQLWNQSDNEIISDRYGNRITLGDAKRALANGLYNANNRAAYNNFMAGYSLPSDAMHYNIYANGGQGGWQTVGGQGVGGGVSMADAMAAYGGQGGYDGLIPEWGQDVIDAQRAMYKAAIDAMRGQRGILDAQYDANAADLYEQYRRTDLALPEMLAGTATGAADSHILENNLNFQNNLEANELARLAAQNDLSAQINQYQAEADLQAAQLAAQYAQQAYEQRMKNQDNGGGSGGGSEPILTASQAWTAWKNGVDTEKVRAALLYHYGYVPDAAEETATTTSQTSSLSAPYIGGTGNGVIDRILLGQELNNRIRFGR